jgi:hypothetical protein
MSPARRLTGAALLFTASIALAAEPRKELDLGGPSGHLLLRTMFGEYGHRPRQSIVREKAGILLTLPRGAAGQTGVYSLFVLAGDCEVTVTYEIISLTPPTKGHGAGVGLAFDLGGEAGFGLIQRVETPNERGGYALLTSVKGGEQPKQEHRFVKTAAKRGWMGLRREKNELVFLASDDLAREVQEIGRLSFTPDTVRSVKLFGDAGEAGVAVHARLGQVRVRAEEITGGVPESERKASTWRWLAVTLIVAIVFLHWF